jgi:hypothetical protein
MIPRVTDMATVKEQGHAKDGLMSNGENRGNGPQFQTTPLVISAAMVGGGVLIALTGLAIGGGHLVAATRQWISEMDVPPSELARLKWLQGRAALAAGAAAWQNGAQSGPEPAIPAER